MAGLDAEQRGGHYSVPLENFTADADLVFFDERLFLRRLDDIDREAFGAAYRGAESSFIGRVVAGITTNWTHCVSVRWQEGGAAPDRGRLATIVDRIGSVVTALRVLHAGQVAVPLNYSWQRTATHVTAGTLLRMLPYVKSPAYHLGAGELESIRHLQVAHEATSERGYRLATRRFDSSYDRLQEEDRLLDLWIALEALFAPDGQRGEITYKVSRRIPFALSDERGRRVEISNLVKRSYDARSKIVHGDLVPDLKSIVDETEDVLRNALRRRWLERQGQKEPKRVVTAIDNAMFGCPGDDGSS